MYSIGLTTLLQLMQGYQQNGRLRAQLPHGTLGLQSSYVFIDVVQGSIISCHIVDTQGQVLTSGRAALNTVAYVGPLDWMVMQEYVHTSPRLPAIPQHTTGQLQAIPQYAGHSSTPHPDTNLVPQRIVPIDSAMLMNFPRHLKRVLVLVDGTRTAGKIASILSPQEDRIHEVLQSLRDLEDMGILNIKRS
ncbi:hypothetical protein [Dictyobacter formicarum]|uniref:DUF4388 domain-containing protein n=1 Tax=Dictyobacter formicarum TaxID=2778368 RepID=A0ABQ3VPN1_9CHLR|nr:hypothetical protein [Dictyobacter formicarum]GHO87333.1 hypothetical protein KSZ_53390 [Dictyobacter formicarum]